MGKGGADLYIPCIYDTGHQYLIVFYVKFPGKVL